MKKFFLTKLGILMLFACVAAPIYSQTSTELINTSQTPEIQDVEGLRADFKQYMQDPETKNTKFEMILKSNINSDRVKVSWTVSGGVALFVDDSLKEVNLSVTKGGTYTIPIVIKTTNIGITELVGKAEAFQAESTYLVTVTKNIITNYEGEIVASVQKAGSSYNLILPDDYQSTKTLMIIKNAALILGLVIILLVGGYVGLKKFISWLNKEDQIKYDPEPLEQQKTQVVSQI